jgi:hypothetical protein
MVSGKTLLSTALKELGYETGPFSERTISVT